MKHPSLAAVLLSAALASCANQSAQPLPHIDAMRLESTATATTTAKVVVRVPSSALATKSIAIAVNGGTPAVANLASGSAGCVAATTAQPLTCTVPLSAAAATDVFAIKTYNAANATGSVLASGTILQAVSATNGATIPVTLGGTVAHLSVQLGRSGATECAPAVTIPVYVRANDSLGNVILTNNYGVAIALHDSDTTGATTLSATSITSSAGTVSLKYNGYKIGPAATVTASASGAAPAAATLNVQQQLYALDANNQYIQVFSPAATGNAAPSRILNERGRITSQVRQLNVSQKCVLYVADAGNNSIFAFAAAASGAAVPVATISGSATALNGPQGVATDASGKIYAPIYNATLRLGGVGIWNAGSNGNVAPATTIMGATTQVAHPASLAFDAVGNLYVLDFRKVVVFAKGASGNATPLRVLLTPSLYCETGMTVDPKGNIYVTDCSNTISEYAAGSSGNAAPIRVINTGASTGPTGVGIDYRGDAFTALQRVPALTSYSASASGTATPLTKVSGSATTLNFPFDVTF